MKKMKKKIYWLSKPQPHDYPAAKNYLSLLFPEKKADEIVIRLKNAPLVHFCAKDVLRASGLLLEKVGKDNKHVKKNLSRIKKGMELSPILLVRRNGANVIVADGFHRACAVYLYDEDSEIPCRIVDLDVGSDAVDVCDGPVHVESPQPEPYALQ